MTDRTLRISARMAEEIQQWASDELSQWPRDTAYAADLENLLSQLAAAAPAPDAVARLWYAARLGIDMARANDLTNTAEMIMEAMNAVECPCKGSDEMCPCQNRRPAPDAMTRLAKAITPAPQPEGEPVTLTYTNWRGETAQRTITPKRIWWGATDWHPEPQWLLTAFDAEKQADRDFALKDFGAADEIDRLRAENERLRAALAPFLKAAELFPEPPGTVKFDISIYCPAAGPEFELRGDDLRRARAALAQKGGE